MSDADAAAIDQTVQDAIAELPDLAGLWIGVWHPDKGFHLEAYGDAVKDSEPATIDQHGRIGSVTKTFTTTAILQQVAEGNLSLDATISDVLPDLATEYPDIADVTVRQLAGMRSPIQDYANTASASVPLALIEALERGQIRVDQKLLLVAFGAGLTWGAAVLQMAPSAEQR